MNKKVPKHIAIIMDGNGRWAKSKGQPRIFGHKAGMKVIKNILIEAKELGIKYLTLYAFSTENWKRPEDEVKGLMFLLKEYLKKERKDLNKNNVKLKFLGRRDNVSKDVLKLMDETVEFLDKNDGITLNIAFNYGGRQEIIDAVNKLLLEKKEKITEEDIQKKLYGGPELPDPELVIRTSGEFRISNFLLWEIAYSEFYITNTLWPDFSIKEFRIAILDYMKRERRFGGLSNDK
ncbi:undecaprenyl pyrophosphate synthetase [Hypnocyclicus thermotrophus]|uniref:Isoprenyl transferase n=1 Tax=Hypnocyclicus thermotrophus TaxID=1627895 RepID=A0AA46DZ03_9FUSO|nr:isoprenyl transferase [Hypnocyclicus thermotrophus]TDT70649.1 undecaprenyl pyrophosphate synthetase [Hypnocyclicus thermotrophus]